MANKLQILGNLVNVVMDTTLSVEGAAADAKAVGDAIAAIDHPVDSVNGKTGAVTLTASDVGALPDTTVIPSIEGLATETYVQEQLTGATVETDETLTIEGAAADAKAVGDALVGKAEQSKSVTITVASSVWTGDAAPYTATVTCSIATASNNLVVGAGGALTTDEQAAMTAAMIVCTAQASGSITLSAFGEKPEIAIPVNIIVVG